MTPAQRESSLALVQKFITTLEYSAIDNRHTPALYARYLKKVLGEPGIVNSSNNSVKSPGAQSGLIKQPGQSEAGASPLTAPHVSNSGLVPPRVAFSPGPSEPGPEEDLLAAMYSLSGDFWDNALLPGTWGIAGNNSTAA
ncbi:hypothetical protein FRC10_001704, partial [Ceratobasidium sp. 414]